MCGCQLYPRVQRMIRGSGNKISGSRWRRVWQPCCELRENSFFSFLYVLFVFLLFYVLDVVSITVYDRHTLLNIGSSIAQRKPDF